MSPDVGFEVRLSKFSSERLEKAIASLISQGFGVLTQIDVRATMKEKLGVEFHPYSILGACNPPLGHRALSSDVSIGLMLPCTLTVEALSDGSSLVRIVDPESITMVGEFTENPVLREVAKEARARLLRVEQDLQS